MNKVRYKQTTFIILSLNVLAVLFTGCTDTQSSFFDTNTPLRFRCDSVETRSSGFSQTGPNAVKSIGIFAAHTESSWTENSPINFMKNQKVERTDTDSPWNYSPEVYWPGSGNTSFFAYAPFDAANLTISTGNGIPELSFDVASTPTEQVDLLVATPAMNITKTSSQGYVNILLRHALTRICFAARLNTGSNKLPNIQITNIQLKDIYHKGTCPMDGRQRNWHLDKSGSTATYSLSSTPADPSSEGELKSIGLDKEYQDITTLSGYLFLMPQPIKEEAVIEVTYAIDNIAQSPITLKLANALVGWQAGESIRYQIAINYTGKDEPVTISLTPSFTTWDNSSTDFDLDADPFLDITDVSVSTYDAAATRVYFYTNQLKEEVYIDPVGQNPITGAGFQVKNEFCNVAKDDVLSDNSTINFFFDPTSHKGYFDLINLDTKTTGQGTNKGRQPLVLTLHAGKLKRSITIQPVISTEISRNDETRYIGTFHRNNETGERIITWSVEPSVEWTASIDQTIGAHSELCIDRIASPDYITSSLYSYSPRNPEGTKVSEEVTSVKGKGRVYFRVGWKTTTSSTRYARIKISYNSGKDPDYLYCRQGEEPEGLTDDNRDNPFSVYNLKSDGIQVDYPTQGGLLSQWGRPREWAPIGSTSTPPTGYPSTVDTSLDLDVNICPVTYAYPDQATIDVLEPALTFLPTIWGYYADGYFDRRSISSHRVEFTSTNVASAGVLLYVKENLHSVFMPTVGYRNETGLLQRIGTAAGYWSKINSADPANAKSMFVQKDLPLATISDYKKTNSLFMRCVKIMDPVTLYFDENGGENAPRPISVTKGNKAYIPTKLIPDNYWKDGYMFDSWNTQIDGKGTKYLPGNEYPSGTPSTDFTKDATLYAQWVADPYIKIDFRKYVNDGDNAANYLLLTSGSYNDYTVSNNGTDIATISPISAIAEKAYPILEFSPEFRTSSPWSSAYDYCKNKYKEKNVSWRLPRIMELLLLTNSTPLNRSILDAKIFTSTSNLMWSGTNYNSAEAYITNLMTTLSFSKSQTTIYRCVHELPR